MGGLLCVLQGFKIAGRKTEQRVTRDDERLRGKTQEQRRRNFKSTRSDSQVSVLVYVTQNNGVILFVVEGKTDQRKERSQNVGWRHGT